jgi:peroxiredoxin
MPVEPGWPAPDFTLPDASNEPFMLSEAYAEQIVLLLFFPGAFTSVCTDEMKQVNDELDEYTTADTRVVGISTDAPSVLAEFKDKHGLDYTFLSDHNAEVCREYDAKLEKGVFPHGLHRFAKRAAFVVDTEGTVRYAEVLDDASKFPDFDAIKETISDLES